MTSIKTTSDSCSGHSRVPVHVPRPRCLPAQFNLTPYLGKAPLIVAFDARGTADPAACYRWEFGDGSVGAGLQTTHNYSAAGSFTVSLRSRNWESWSGRPNLW